MFRIDDPSAAAALPAPEAAGTEGFWTEGNPATGVPATLERASWFNMIQEELRAIVVAGGVTPSKTVYNQVLTAIQALIAPTGISQFASSKAASGYQKLPSGLIVQWGQFVQNDNGASLAYTTTLPIEFPTGGLQAFLTPGNAVPTSGSGTVESVLKASITGYTNANTATRTWRYLAIGY